jgi:hypothetical protein
MSDRFFYTRYPKNWKEISRRIRFERAGGQCEWIDEDGTRCPKKHGDPLTGPRNKPGSRVVLTVAHLGVTRPDGTPGSRKDKSDCRDENLMAMCQAHHLAYDLEDHIENRRKNKEKKDGQQRLF